MTLRVIGGVILFVISMLSHGAGSDFLRIVCVPEARYFSVEYKYADSEDEDDTEGLSQAEIKAQKRAWQRNGYYDTAALDYECRLPAVDVPADIHATPIACWGRVRHRVDAEMER